MPTRPAHLCIGVVMFLVLACDEVIEAKQGQSSQSSSNVTRPCPQPKVGKCSCHWTGDFCRITCSGLDAMPKNLPLKLLEIKLVSGMITKVPEDYFTPFEYLQVIMLQNNKVSNKFRLPKRVWNVDLQDNMMTSSDLHGMFDGLRNVHQINLDGNQLQDNLVPGTFKNLEKLTKLDLRNNEIHTLRKDTFKGIKNTKKRPIILELGFNKIHHIEDGTFKDFLEIQRLDLDHNNLTKLPDLQGILEEVDQLDLSDNRIPDFNSLDKYGIKHFGQLLLGHNRISKIPPDIFKEISILRFLDLSDNLIKHIPGRFLRNSPYLVELILQNNQIESMDRDSFEGLSSNLQGLYLFNNKIKQLPDGVFRNLPLVHLLLNSNDLRNLTGRPFKGMKRTTTLYLFSNKITHIDDDFFEDLERGTHLVITCANLVYLPRVHRNSTSQIVCAPHGLTAIKHLNNKVAKALDRSGFSCVKHFTDNSDCTICKNGSYGNGSYGSPNCTPCSAGGFYQDEMGKVSCKKCNIGTYVHPRNAPGNTPLSCQACPQGTNSSEDAGYRACKCLKDFYRLDRFGECHSCPYKAFKCENDYATLSKGFYWKWLNVTYQQQYLNFTNNLEVESSEVLQKTWKYDGTLPRPHKCPRKSCLGGLESSCSEEYQGPLCAVCKPWYYDRMNSCNPCPSRLQAGLQVAGVLVVFVLILFALLWGEKKRTRGGRTMTDVILSCFKIMVGFYQVMEGLYSSFSKVQWPSSVIWMQKTLHFIELSVLQFAPLSCLTPKLSFNALQQFILVSTANVVIVFVILLYLVVRISQLKRKKSLTDREVAERVAHVKISCIRNICVFLFATYPRTCTSIIKILSINCVPLCFDKNEEYCESYLRSDFSIKCDASDYVIYSKVAFASLLYPIGFPVAILVLVWKYVHRPAAKHSVYQEVELPEILEENKSTRSAIVYNPNQTKTPLKSGLSLFYENYKPNCWYWEAVEMTRKLILISGLTLIGEQSRTQIGLGAIISALFAILYVYLRPIANKFENFLQTVALMAIFLNLGIGVMLKISDDELSTAVNKRNDKVGVSILLIVINTAVIAIVTVTCLKIVILRLVRWCKSADHTCRGDDCCKVCGLFCLTMLLPSRLDNADSTHGELRSRLLEDSYET